MSLFTKIMLTLGFGILTCVVLQHEYRLNSLKNYVSSLHEVIAQQQLAVMKLEARQMDDELAINQVALWTEWLAKENGHEDVCLTGPCSEPTEDASAPAKSE